jgi:hypothetical protein
MARDILSRTPLQPVDNTAFKLWNRSCLINGMTSEKKSFLLGQLQEAIDEAISESGRITAIIDEMKRHGFDLMLMLESTVTISPTEDHQPDVLPEPRLRSSAQASAAELKLSDEDLDFFRQLKIAA